MHFMDGIRTRLIRAGLVLAMSAALASCATTTGGVGGSSSPGPATGDGSGSGRLMLTITNQNGNPVSQANVEARGAGNYRAVAVTDGRGTVEFNRVPAQVEVSVNTRGGYGNQTFAVLPGAMAQERMIIQEIEDDSQEQGIGGAGGVRR